jgi:4-nitrophenyl phosphatase
MMTHEKIERIVNDMQTMQAIKNLILDMDGVLWRGETPMPGLVEFFAALRRKNINFVLATNNATKTAVMYTEKLARFGVQVAPEQILTSAETTAVYLSERYEGGTAVYVIGEKGLHDALTSKGFHIITPEEVKNGATATLVVVGFNGHVTYFELAMGALLVHKGAAFIGTNPDPSYPSELGPLPGAGSLLAVIQTATGVSPLIVGKPQPIIFQAAVKRLGGTLTDTAMVGDRLTTDIAGGKAVGLATILLLSGVTNHVQTQNSPIQPDHVFADITDLANHLDDHS